MNPLKKVGIVISVVLLSTVAYSYFNKASAVTTEVGSIRSSFKGLFDLLANPCSMSDAKKEAVANQNVQQYGEDIDATNGAQWFSSCAGNNESASTSSSPLENTTLGRTLSFSIALYEEKPSSAILWFNQQYYAITGQGEVYAQLSESNNTPFYRPGPGFSLLAPLQGLWAWSRNLAYVAFIILIIVVGFLILFRNRLDGQTPITIFNSIPSMILSLVLITFSYPISAFFVDFITIGTELTQNILIASPGSPGYSYIWDETGGLKTWTIAQGIDIDRDGQPDTINKNMLQPDDPQMSVWQIFNTSGAQTCKDADNNGDCDATTFLPDQLGAATMFGQMIEFVVQFVQFVGLSDVLIGIIIGFAAFTASIKLFLTLLNKYIVLTIGVVLAPWYFFVAGLPSKTNSTITDFFKVHFGAALSFVAVYFIFLFLIVFVQAPTTTDFTWVPPLMGYSDRIIQGNLVAGIISYGIYLATPTIPELIDQMLDIPEGNVLAQAVGDRFKSAAGAAAGYGRNLASSFLPGVPGIGGGGRH